jgi:superfamily I DNA/RNA helicase
MIAIDPEAVQRIASSLGLTVDEKNVKFLLHTSKCDVHACPGSGKTTLLVAKLALLAREWQWRDCGVLVLSHTNVARHEIETRLAHDPVGPRLLAYPHFVGTVQAFVNRFLALPYMRDLGLTGSSYTQPQIDDDVFADRAWRRFDARRWKEYRQASGYL